MNDPMIHSITRMAQCDAPNGNTYAVGKNLSFKAPILPGWAKFLRVEYDLTVTVVLGGGTATASAAAPYNMFQTEKLSYGGVAHREHHPYFNKLLKQTSEHDGGFWNYGGPNTQSYAATLMTALPTAAGPNSWKGAFDIPLQMAPGLPAGLLPMGSSATPITLELNGASAFTGTDPWLNPVIVTGGATATVTGTVKVYVYYLYPQSPHDPRIVPDTPIIGSFAKIVQNEKPVTSTAGVTFDELKEPYPHLKVFQVLIIPGAAAFSTFANIAGAEFRLDSGTPMWDYTDAGAGIMNLWRDQRDKYGQDLDPGVIAWDMISGSDPEHADGTDTVHIGFYNAAKCGIHYNGALAADSNRIITAAMFIEPLSF